MSNSIATGVAYADPEFVSLSVSGASTNGPAASITSTSANTGSVDASAFVATETLSAAGGVGFSIKAVENVNVVAGAYLTALYGYLAFGASGRVTGLASGTVGEIVMSAACTQGTYAAMECEIGMPTGAVTGTNTSFFYLSSYGADKATFDTSGTLFNLAGVTKGTGKLLADTTTGSTARPVQVIKVVTPDGVRYLPLYSTVAIAA
jgi:hypothetical protein